MIRFDAGELVRVLYTKASGNYSRPVRVKRVYGKQGETEMEEAVHGCRYWNQDDLYPVRLRDVLPEEFDLEYSDTPAAKLLDERVVAIHRDDPWWPGKQRNVNVWWKLANGKSVGWNENPSRGWSFPVIKTPA